MIVDATRRLPASLAPSQVTQVERTLVAKARTTDPVDLRRAARRALEVVERDRARVDAHEDALLRDEEAAALAKTRFWVRDNGDGTMTGGFTVPRLAGSILSKTIQQLASPRRSRRGATTAQAGPVGGTIDWAHRHGESFVELLEHLPTDRLHGKVAATVLVTVEHAKLVDAVGAADLDVGEQLSAGEARRVACGAGILPAVLGGASQVLDLGRSQRFFTEAQRVAGALHHQTCAADGCDRPYSWCELHHREPWHRGGSTDQANLVPLCGFHHRRIHDPGYHHRARPGGGITFHRRT